METKKVKKPNWLMSPITTVEFAKEIIKQTGQGFIALAAIQGILGYLIMGAVALVDSAILLALSFWLMKKHSVWATILLLVFSLIGLASTMMNYFGGTGGRNIILSIITIAIAYRALLATRFLQKNK